MVNAPLLLVSVVVRLNLLAVVFPYKHSNVSVVICVSRGGGGGENLGGKCSVGHVVF